MFYPKCNELADFMEEYDGPVEFNMSSWCHVESENYFRKTSYEVEVLLSHAHKCGTTACIAGFAVLKYSEDKIGRKDPHQHIKTIEKLAQRVLELPYETAMELFSRSELTEKGAIATLRYLARTGDLPVYIGKRLIVTG